MTTVFVTGCAGYIGSTLVRRLLTRSSITKVIGLDNLMFRQTSLLDLIHNPKFEFHHGDVKDFNLLGKLSREADVIIPLAALVGMPACDANPREAVAVNRDHVIHLTMHKKFVIYPNTNSGYGVGIRDRYCTEESPLNPISLYGTTKCQAEQAVLDSGGVSLRLATVFGLSARMRLDLLVNDFVYRACRDGYLVLFEADFKRNYIHVQDVCKAFILMLTTPRKAGQVYNVGLSQANLSKRELCSVIKNYIPKLAVLESEVGTDPDKRDYLVSNKKLEECGWRPDHTLDMGIKELIAGYPMLRRVETQHFSNL